MRIRIKKRSVDSVSISNRADGPNPARSLEEPSLIFYTRVGVGPGQVPAGSAIKLKKISVVCISLGNSFVNDFIWRVQKINLNNKKKDFYVIGIFSKPIVQSFLWPKLYKSFKVPLIASGPRMETL